MPSGSQIQAVVNLPANYTSRITVVIPTRNEERNLEDVIKQVRKFTDDILVVDGHSTDGTRALAASLGARVILDRHKGKGDGLRCAAQNIDREITVFIDADGSHDPADIPKLIEPIFAGKADHVTGSRMRGGSDELHGDFNKFLRMVGSDIITLGINWRFGVVLTDTQNGFRALRTDVLKKLDLRENITTIEQEMIIKTLRAGYRMGEVAAHEYERKYGESVIKLRRVWFRYVYSWLKYLLIG